MLLLLLLGTVALTAASADLEEYNRRVKVVNDLNEIFQEYLDTYIGDKQRRNELMENFFSLYEAQFDDSDEWLVDALTSGEADGVVNATIRANYYDLAATTKFLNTAMRNVETAGEVNFRYHMEKDNVNETQRIRDFMPEARQRVRNLTLSATAYVRSGWKADCQRDVDATVTAKAAANVDQLAKAVRDRLRHRFNFREWLVVVFSTKLEIKECLAPGTFSYRSAAAAGHGRTVMVVMAPHGYFQDRRKGAERLGKIKDSKSFVGGCKNRPANILGEGGISCAAPQVHYAAVYKEEAGTAAVASTKPALLAEKQVHRGAAFFFCQAKYNVLLFA